MNLTHVSALLVALSVFACGELLSIEEARVDPSLTDGGRPSGGSPNTFAGQVGAGGSQAGAAATPGGGPANGGGTQEGGAGGASAGQTICDQYCSAMEEYCTGALLQYRDTRQCLKVCALFEEGALGDPDANTASCRLKYASKARYAAGTELAAYCRQAGPGGDDRCGANCDGFCSIMMGTCNRETAGTYYYADTEACLEACAPLDQIPYTYGDASVADGSSVQCRIFHVTSALMADPEEHCEHSVGLTLCESGE